MTPAERQALERRAQGDPSAVPWCDAGGRMTDLRRLPNWLYGANVLRAVLCSDGCEIDELDQQTLQTQAEMFVRQVAGRTEPGMTWRLSWLEQEMGLPDGGLTGLTDNQRRDRIIARLRSWRIPTAFAIRSIAQAYAGNDVQVVMDYESYAITIRFTGGTLPANLQDLQGELIRIIPAHLAPIYWVVTFLTWGDCEEVGVQWCQLEDAGWTWDQLEVAARADLPIDVVCAP